MRYRGNKICPDERKNDGTDGQPENIMSPPTVSYGESIINPGLVVSYVIQPGPILTTPKSASCHRTIHVTLK